MAERGSEVRDAVRSCYPEPPIIAGYSEPSAVFLMGIETTITTGSRVPDQLNATPRALAFIELKHRAEFLDALRESDSEELVRVGCVSGRNAFSSRRWQHFEIYAKPPLPSDPACTLPVRYQCVD